MSAFRDFASYIGDTASAAVDAVEDTVSDAGSAVADTASTAYDAASDAASSAYDAATDTASSAYASAVDDASQAYDTVSEAASDAYASTVDDASQAYDTLSEAASDTYDVASDAASSAYDAATDATGSAYDEASSAYDAASDIASSAYDTASSAVDSVEGAVSEYDVTSADVIHGAVDLANQAEHGVVQAGVGFAEDEGVISPETGQAIVHGEEVLQGVREAGVDMGLGMLPKPGELALPGVPDFTAMEHMQEQMGQAYDQAHGGLDGVLAAADVINPAYHAMTAGYETVEAVEAGDYKTAGKKGTQTALDVAATVGVAAGGAGLAGAAADSLAVEGVEAGEVADTLSVEGEGAGEVAEDAPGDPNSPLFEDLGQEEIDAAFDQAESGTYMELPGKNPETGEGLQSVKIRSGADKTIAHNEEMKFKGIKDTPTGKVQVRRHSANPNAPEWSNSHDNPTTQIQDGELYRLPDGSWKKIKDMTPEEREAAHYE